MTIGLDETHDPSRKSFVEEANDPRADFPIQNLPLGVFSTSGDRTPRLGVAIGNRVLDLKRTSKLGLLPKAILPKVLEDSSLNALFALGQGALRELRLLSLVFWIKGQVETS